MRKIIVLSMLSVFLSCSIAYGKEEVRFERIVSGQQGSYIDIINELYGVIEAQQRQINALERRFSLLIAIQSEVVTGLQLKEIEKKLNNDE